MDRLVAGIVKFQESLTPEARARFGRLALGQKPDSLMIACGDSRVVPNLFASTDPGDLFVIRNVGNIVPPPGASHVGGVSAAIEYALGALEVRNVIVCGHSRCGAMEALLRGRSRVSSPALRWWLGHAEDALLRLRGGPPVDPTLPEADRLSQVNVLVGIERIRAHPLAARPLAERRLGLHAWWFDIAAAEVLAHSPAAGRFVPVGAPG